MFTGIIEKKGTVIKTKPTGGTATEDALLLTVSSSFTDLELGESIAVNGVCLTVTEFQKNPIETESLISFFVSKETLQATCLGQIQSGDFVNLERSLALQSRLSGHLVQGHVDGTAHLRDLSCHADSYSLTFILPKNLGRYCVQKGSIALNGISLTLQTVSDQNDGTTLIQVMIIPHTWTHTNLSRLKLGDPVNIELDVFAKYVERLCQH